MKIKTKLYISAAIAIGLTFMLASVSFYFSNEISSELGKAELADELVKGTTELYVITDEYLAYHEVRMEQQWQSKFDSIMELVNKEEESVLLAIVRTNYESLDNSFSQLKANYTERDELLKTNAPQEEVDKTIIIEERLDAQMRLNSQKILANAFRISSESRQEANAMQQTRNSLISVVAAFLVLIIGASAFLITRSITKPIGELVRGTSIIGRGNLKHRIDIKSRDETGHLSQAFNEMVEQLNQYSEHLEELVKERTSELGEKTADLEQANIRLQEVDRLKSVFLASMSHELRTPLNSIIGFTGIILQGMAGEVNEEQRKQLTMVRNSASHLLSLINDVLDVSKIEAGKVELSLQEFSLDDVVGEVVETFSPEVNQKGLELLAQVPEGLTLFSDRRHIKQVLMNLVSNAVKFTNQGSVKIAARVLGDDNLEIHVIDTGVGIKKEDMDKLFVPFQQIDMSLTKSHEGTGLGLHLTKKLAAVLGGDISANSEYGRGSEFTFTLPLRYEGEQRNEESAAG